ncbi:CPBP family intramembrane glutamic endopeptidase [Lederbergia citri]|uniref:CPBP family intramembrane metalloprotease n=1 Tax=Lederbergia citri TaxID=2833580 RepID=A0A942YHX9_9BACI|nr:CPBP family intramembrane glutamic endopeptidase [Lederbergia citri]MBS4196309.1 CPBP family intramembrane metalloprotease [Lederbergia citri]
MNKKILYFLLINFTITWGAWITVLGINQDVPLQPGQFSYILYGLGGLLGPVVAAILVRGVWGEKGEVKALLKQTIHARVHIGWYIFSMIVPFILIITPSLLHLVFTGEFLLHFNQPLYLIFLTLPVSIIGGGLEEVGWRGLLLPELCKKYSILVSDLIIFPIWAIWHLPLWFMKGTPQFGSSFMMAFLSLLGITLVLAVIYVKTKSIFLCVLFHSFINSFGMNIEGPRSVTAMEEVVVIVFKITMCALIFWLFMKQRTSSIIHKSDFEISFEK